MDNDSYSDVTTTVSELKRVAQQFVSDRHWEPYHTPKNLAMSTAIEAAELMECFQWLTPEESYQVKNDPEKMIQIGDEIADVFAYLLNLCSELDVDLAAEFVRKSAKNAQKYPLGLDPETNH